ncbi:hypothetical protein [uncultured Cohaesibacter sp.]|uniref:hypothetical protein n=1 Tax=uncultured Cohaesibacter sp. TaxID=1002546 RepID=UPI0029C8B0D5|nr:hypothetical protein [uncultured Cohaesibacter sp.]
MTADRTDEEKIIRGADANALMANRLLQDALDDIEKKAIDAVLSAKDDDTRRESAFLARVTREFRSKIMAVARTGDQAAERTARKG